VSHPRCRSLRPRPGLDPATEQAIRAACWAVAALASLLAFAALITIGVVLVAAVRS
jgi:hypothetical protein